MSTRHIRKFLVNAQTIIIISTCFVLAGQAGSHSKGSASGSPKVLDSKTGAAATKQVAIPDKQILFFMNPNGRPCQMQLEILDGMKEKLKGLATIKYVKTTEQADQALFYDYGIRGLPSLVVLDKTGKEFKRFTPGIQDEKTIMSALTVSSK